MSHLLILPTNHIPDPVNFYNRVKAFIEQLPSHQHLANPSLRTPNWVYELNELQKHWRRSCRKQENITRTLTRRLVREQHRFDHGIIPKQRYEARIAMHRLKAQLRKSNAKLEGLSAEVDYLREVEERTWTCQQYRQLNEAEEARRMGERKKDGNWRSRVEKKKRGRYVARLQRLLREKGEECRGLQERCEELEESWWI